MGFIYLDHAATAPLLEEVWTYMDEQRAYVFANPSSVHGAGRMAKKHIEKARQHLAEALHAKTNEVIFTSGGTEASNLGIHGLVKAHKSRGKHIITTKQEHQATLGTVQALEKEGFTITYIDVDETGQLDYAQLEASITEETVLITTMFVNNETGVLQPIEKIGNLAQAHNIFFHVDAVQALGLFELDVEYFKIDAMSLSAHKIGGPNGIGLLYIREGIMIEPQILGGSQERARRAGTENALGILGFSKSVEVAQTRRLENKEKYTTLRNLFIAQLTIKNIEFQINGATQLTSPAILNISFTGIPVEVMLTNLDLEQIGASGGSACTAGTLEPSHVLIAMHGEEDSRISEAIRFSFGMMNDMEQIKETAKRIGEIVARLRK